MYDAPSSQGGLAPLAGVRVRVVLSFAARAVHRTDSTIAPASRCRYSGPLEWERLL